MKPIRIAQIGIGHNHGEAKMIALRKLPELFDIVGVCESDPVWYEKRHALPGYQGLRFMPQEELLAAPGLEAVAIETDGPALLPTARRVCRPLSRRSKALKSSFRLKAKVRLLLRSF